MLKIFAPVALATSFIATNTLAGHLEELVVTGSHDTRTIDVNSALVISADAAQLLRHAPGANVNGNGPLTGIVQYRGMYGSRVATSMDGRQIAPAGPNWMDPPLSYAAAGQLESLELYRGIAPVSIAQESIGGAITVKTHRGSYTQSDEFTLSGQLLGNAQAVNSGTHLNAALYAANKNHRIKIAAMTETGDDAEFVDGDITPSEYDRQRYDVGYGYQNGRHSVQLDFSNSDTGETGTPALPMDIDFIEGDLYSLSYTFALSEDLSIEAKIFGADLEHGMSNFHLRAAPPAPMWRRNIANTDNSGLKLIATLQDGQGNWVFGIDNFQAQHDSDIDNPNNPMFFVTNFNSAERYVSGVFLERQHNFSDHWRGEFGLRYNRVEMDSGEVDGAPARMMPPAQALRDAFNNADRNRSDNNADLVAKLWYTASESTNWYAGIAQKHRAPSFQERYLWLPLQATAGLADGFTYTGNIELNSEVSRQIEAGFDYSVDNLKISPRIYYHKVDDYIQGTPSGVAPALIFVRMMNANNGTNNPDPLQFNNVEAEIYGMDLDWAWQLNSQWSLSGIVNYVRGKRDDIDDNLYRIAPPNTSVSLNYASNHWRASAESVLYAKQDDVSETNAEQETAGYGTLNLKGSWEVTEALQLAAGVDNVFNKGYEDHIGGYNRAGNSDIPRGERLPGYGRNLFVRASYSF